MLKQLTKRKGKVNPQLKELNNYLWDYIGLREDIIHYVATHTNKDMARFAEDAIMECETTLGVGLAIGSIEEKLHNHQKAINKLKTTKQFIEMYGTIAN